MGPDITRRIAPRPTPHRRYRPIPARPRRLRSLYPGEPETCRRSLRRFLPVLGHLGLLLAVFKVYRVEGRAFQLLAAIALATLPVHYLLPFRLKKPAFVAISVLGLAWVFGAAVAAVVLPVALLLIGLCRCGLPWGTRVAAVGAVAAVLALARAGVVAIPVPDAAWPVLGSLLMFRMVLYLYELKHARRDESLVDALSYFFLLPNFCFLHFPVVDYRAFQRGYFAADIHTLQRQGLRMMLRGTVHLLLYRLVYHELLVPADEVHGAASLAGYIACNYLLYLRVSGQFHMACGLLHLFGFQLPETHHGYLLATGFTDYWRRINIYWKDFMVRVVFNPVVFRLKRRPQPVALAVATVTVFVATWALHAYQSFWLRGTWGFSVPDALFWGILGALVLVNVQLEARSHRPRRLASRGQTPRDWAVRAAKAAGTFVTIALLWSLWSSPSVGAWLGLWRRAVGSRQ
jgi:alginate O-acetyltransferase complex protein AlgI